ncbi:hypothetical protein GGI42DRAFT_283598 [Trichoderma sp. SZMC 28013]
MKVPTPFVFALRAVAEHVCTHPSHFRPHLETNNKMSLICCTRVSRPQTWISAGFDHKHRVFVFCIRAGFGTNQTISTDGQLISCVMQHWRLFLLCVVDRSGGPPWPSEPNSGGTLALKLWAA